MKKRVMIIANNSVGLFKFRKELIEALLDLYEVHIVLPYGEFVDKLIQMGCIYHRTEFNRHGTNPVSELLLMNQYNKIICNVKPETLLTYTIKPNIYGGILCSLKKIPYVPNITGLGTAIENGGILQKLLLCMYRCSLKKAQNVFFQNEKNADIFVQNKIIRENYQIIPGSGVNLTEHIYEPYPTDQENIVLLIIGRIMRDKGSDEVLYAAEKIKKEYPNVTFRMLGMLDGDYEEKIQTAVKNGYIEYCGQQSDVHSYIKESHATVHASYHEGMANVLLETAASGRPVIATDVPGCRETYTDGISGISCRARDKDDLVRAIREFLELPHSEKEKMGIAGRKKMECEFDRKIVVEQYLNEIEKAVR